ncbi:MAG: VOC family protein [Peptococcaceae bacterium]|nr:VOC family protein [Peptococcaceae bacterium]
MHCKGTLIAVKDMEKAKCFYHDVLGLNVVDDFGANVVLTEGVFLQTAETWKTFIRKTEKEIIYANNASELYFETNDMDDFIGKLSSFSDISYLHPLLKHSWGQRAVRFYDLDGHIIEVGENIVMVVKRFISSGLSIEETAKRMDVDVNYINSCLE